MRFKVSAERPAARSHRDARPEPSGEVPSAIQGVVWHGLAGKGSMPTLPRFAFIATRARSDRCGVLALLHGGDRGQGIGREYHQGNPLQNSL